MRLQHVHLPVLLALLWICEALLAETTDPVLRGKQSFIFRDGVKRTIFQHEATGAQIEFVTNSGICETTPGVKQYSGHLNVGDDEMMWFWFFEARNDPDTAPLAMWLNGGPGCSSMVGLFQENGPCHFINGSSTPTLNPYSFNEYANMLYIDQPLGTGFSHGTGKDSASSTVTAAPYVWKLLQAFFAQFPRYRNRDFGLFTESYGGHYGPEFASYFTSQNAAIAAGSLVGWKISLVALGINNGWFDPVIQEKASIHYSYNNTYKPIISALQHTIYLDSYETYCLPLLKRCGEVTGTNEACENAYHICYNTLEFSMSSVADMDVYDVRKGFNNPFPPKTYVTYLRRPEVVRAIGASDKFPFTECSDSMFGKFTKTGDNARSFLPTLSRVVQSGITTLIWAGDADWICNWYGGLESADAVVYDGAGDFRKKEVSTYYVDGVPAGTFKSVGNLSWMRVFEAGHHVPYYQPRLALQVFKQTMQRKAVFST
ncbi:Alpha/Beta hydrolase protein [Rhexocercosporidium sp. MPI-PUGE-AT-0058]|nr:Alpha/Beta hydrolase protein [Rhexocercosporidium sp. MPI-PUGE-AT-0058]